MLYPGADVLDNTLRWGFVRKVRSPVAAGAGSSALSRPVRSAPACWLTSPHAAASTHSQVYGIIAAQLVLTTIVAAVVVTQPSVQHFMLRSVGLQFGLLLASMLGLIPLYIYRNSHPANLALLGVWTCLFSGARAGGGGQGKGGGRAARGARSTPHNGLADIHPSLQSPWAWPAPSTSR